MNPTTESHSQRTEPEGQAESEPGGTARSPALEWRWAIGRHEFPEPAGRIVDRVLVLWEAQAGAAIWDRRGALVPSQRCFVELCGLSKSKVSESISWLCRCRVLEVTAWDAGRGRRPWGWYRLFPPGTPWRVPLRVEESIRLAELEVWLSALRPEQTQLIEVPESINDVLVETALTALVPPQGTPSSLPENSVVHCQRTPSGAEGQGGTGGDKKVHSQRTSSLGENQASSLGVNFGVKPDVSLYTRGRAGVDRSIDYSIRKDRSTDRSDRDRIRDTELAEAAVAEAWRQRNLAVAAGRESSRDYARRVLFECIGAHEEAGGFGQVWLQACERIPDRVVELVAHVRMLQREGRVKTTAARWLNASVRSELGLGK